MAKQQTKKPTSDLDVHIFPAELYVTLFDQSATTLDYDAQVGWEDCEDGDVVAVYTLDRVTKVHETREKRLVVLDAGETT